MNKFITAAERILLNAKKPLKSVEITRLAIEAGFLKSKGKTPERSMNAQLNTHIKLKGPNSIFTKTARSTFTLAKNE